MPRILKLVNLNFIDADDFKPFEVNDYSFLPIEQRQKISLFSNRSHSVNAKVIIPPNQPNSVLRKGGKKGKRSGSERLIKLLDDMLIIVSILIGRNVVQWSDRAYSIFPAVSSKHCNMISKNSTSLKNDLDTAINTLLLPDWQTKFENGFHVLMFYNCADLFVDESRFISNVKIWEFLYAHDIKDLDDSVEAHYYKLRKTKLETKICHLLRRYLLNNKNLSLDKLDIFIHLRNQLTHYGKLPVIVPDAPDWIRSLGWSGCKWYLRLFERLTQLLVLKTLGIDGIQSLNLFNVSEHLSELVSKGRISFYEKMDKAEIT